MNTAGVYPLTAVPVVGSLPSVTRSPVVADVPAVATPSQGAPAYDPRQYPDATYVVGSTGSLAGGALRVYLVGPSDTSLRLPRTSSRRITFDALVGCVGITYPAINVFAVVPNVSGDPVL